MFLGDLVYVNILGKSIVIISSANVAYDLFEKRSLIYSNQFKFPHGRIPASSTQTYMVHMLFCFTPRHTCLFTPRELLQRLYKTPDLVTEYVRHTAGAIIMEVCYGHFSTTCRFNIRHSTSPHRSCMESECKQDPYLSTAEKTTKLASVAFTGSPGLFLVDMIPIRA
jgi:hypothetical protein